MFDPATRFVPSEDGVEVAVHDYGGPGHPTIFVHGCNVLINLKHNDPARANPDRIVSSVQFSKSKIILSAGFWILSQD